MNEASVLRDLLRRVRRRSLLAAAMRGATIGALAALPILLVAGPWAAVVVVLGALIGMLRTRPAALLLEERYPQSRNLLLTAAELGTATVSPVRAQVLGAAARMAENVDAAALLPLRGHVLLLMVALSAWVLVPTVASVDELVPGAMGASGRAAINQVTVIVEPPAYTGIASTQLRDPEQLAVLAGSRVRIEVDADAERVLLETPERVDTLRGSEHAVVVSVDGYLALTAEGQRGSAHRLIAVEARPDGAPAVRITDPGSDRRYPDGRRRLEVTVAAEDDIALSSLSLTFTRVRGAGEQHTFTHGTVPLTVVRDSARGWRARGTLPLDTLALEPGDMVVYRAAARDNRPGSSGAESDAFIVEIMAPGDVAAAGFSADDEERYALSQQMVLMKTERLLARRGTLDTATLRHEAATIAAEQRSVRAEFVFMMGGELAEEIAAEASMDDLNEEAHAEADDEAIAGRLRNQGRVDLLAAIRAMSRANRALLDVELERARTEERTAIDALQRAFSRTRYILRALTQRKRLDAARRLTGDLTGVTRITRAAAEALPDARLESLRDALARASTLRAGDRDGAARIALVVLRADPSSERLRRIATQLATATQSDLDSARIELGRLILASQSVAALPQATLDAAQLRGAVRDARR